MELERINILEEIGSDDFTTSIILSYGIDVYFYEQIIFKRLRQIGCRNNIVFIDSNRYDDMVSQHKTDFTLVGKHYSVVPIKKQGCFHPKIVFLSNQSKIKILIGSGNLNLGGYSLNNETFAKIEIEVENSEKHSFVKSIWEFIKGLCNAASETFLNRQLSAVESEYPWLLDENKGSSIITIENIEAEFLFHQDKLSILQQFLNRCKGQSVSEVTIVSPFFDEECKALKTIGKTFPSAKINVIIDPTTVNLNIASFPKTDEYKLFRFYRSDDKRGYLHSKIYHITTNKGEIVLLGSSNCTNNGLGTMGGMSQNSEACVLLKSNKKKIFYDSLGLGDHLSSKQLIDKKMFSQILYKKESDTQIKYDFIVLNLEYKSEKVFAQIDIINPKIKYCLVLYNGEDTQTIAMQQIESNELVFEVSDEFIANYQIGYIKTDKDKRSNPLFINFYHELIDNAPSPRTAKIADIVRRIELEGGDWIELIDDLDTIFFHDQNHKYFVSRLKKNVKNEKSVQNVPDQFISYEEFLSRTRAYDALKAKRLESADNSDFAILNAFIFKQFSLLPKDINKPRLNNDGEIDTTIYAEETKEEIDDSNESKKVASKIPDKKKDIEKKTARYYRNRVNKLARRYIEYLDLLTKGDSEKHIQPPSLLSINEMSKFNLMAALINYYAGKTVGDEEIFYMDGDEFNSYWGLMTQIIWKCFCYNNENEGHYPIIQKIRLESRQLDIPLDLHFTITMAAFSICVLLEFFKDDEELRKLQIAAYRLYYNTGLDTNKFNFIEIKDSFEKYYKKSGFYEYKNILESKYLHFDKILSQHEIIVRRMKSIRKQMQGISKRYADNMGNHPSVRKGSYIWTPTTGLSYAVDVHGKNAVVFDWGIEAGEGKEVKYGPGFVMEVKVDDKE